MSKTALLGVVVLLAGVVLGFVIGGTAGIVLATFLLIVGFVMVVSSYAKRTEHIGEQATRPAHQKVQLLFLVKELHARPQKAGRFQEVRDPNQEGLEFELFLLCWLVNETDLSVRLDESLRLTFTSPGAVSVTAERVPGDLGNWHLGKLSMGTGSWDLATIRAAQEPITELNTTEPLECGLPREGWLHFRVRGLTPAQLQAADIEIRGVDSLWNVHQTRPVSEAS